MCAARAGSLERLKFMVERGGVATCNVLQAAIFAGDIPCMQYIIQKGNFEKDNPFPCEMAVMSGNSGALHFIHGEGFSLSMLLLYFGCYPPVPFCFFGSIFIDVIFC